MGNNVVKLKHYEPIKEPGVHFRLICVSGELAGQSFLLKGNRIVLGRSEKADIQILDIKLSREHAEIVRLSDYCVLTDLNSVNGIYVNDQRVKQKSLLHDDKIMIGRTVFEYKVEQGRSDRPVAIAKSQDTNALQKTREGKTTGPVKSGKAKKRGSGLLVVVVAVLGALFFLPTDPEKDVQFETEGSKTEYDDLDRIIQEQIEARRAFPTSKKVKGMLKKAIREAREGNYYRAMGELELADRISSENATVDAYRRMVKEKRDRVIEEYIKNAKRDQNALKFQSALSENCAILRMLYNEANTDNRFKEAKERIKQLEVLMGKNEGETECIPE